MTRTNRDVWTRSFVLSDHMWWSVFSVDAHMMRDPSWLLDPLWCAKEYMRSVAHVLRARHGSGAVIVASRMTGTVTLLFHGNLVDR